MSVGLLEVQATNPPVSVFGTAGMVDVSAVGKLQPSIADIVERLGRELDDIALQAASALNAREFEALRKGLFPAYVKLSVALGNVVLAKLDVAELPGIIRASFDALEGELAAKAPSYFGDDTCREIMFSVSTLKSASRWLPKLVAVKVSEDRTAQDMELAQSFTTASVWSHFHLEAIRASLRKSQSIAPDVLQELLEGLRFSVMAYAYARQALDLRDAITARYDEELTVSWDEEDETLANAI